MIKVLSFVVFINDYVVIRMGYYFIQIFFVCIYVTIYLPTTYIQHVLNLTEEEEEEKKRGVYVVQRGNKKKQKK